MDWHFISYLVVLAFAALISLSVAMIGLLHRDRTGGLALGLAMLAVATWALFYILEASAPTLVLKVRWSQLAYLGTLSACPLFLRLALDVTKQSRWWRGVLPWLVWSVPVLSLLLVFTNDAHGLIWRGFTFSASNPQILIYERGPAFWPMAVHSYLVLLGAVALLIGTATRYRAAYAHSVYRRQVLLALFAAAPPWILNGLYLLRSGVLGGRDPTPLGFALTGLLLLWNIDRFHFIDLLPVARDRVFASLKDAVIVVDDRGRIADVNPAAERILRRSNLVGSKARISLAHWLGTPGLPGSGGVDFLPPQGELVTADRTLEWRVAPLEAGSTPGYIILLHDVTLRKQAEAALQALNATLEVRVAERTAQILAEKERSDAILRSISDGIVMTDRDAYILYVNPTFTYLSGYDAEETLGCPVAEILGESSKPLLEPMLSGDETRQEELQLRHKDGRIIDIAMNISPVRGHGGAREGCGATGYVCTLRDITGLRNLDRARKSFIDNISHQLRTPVTNLKLYAHLMGQSSLSDESHAYLQVIEDQTAWLQHLIEDILEMTSLDSGQAIRAWNVVSPATLVDHIATRYQREAERVGLRVHVHPQPSTHVPAVLGDQIRLIQAMGEIADNAIRFTPRGGEVSVRSAADKDEYGREWVTLSIADTGPGIPLAEQPRLFDRFFRGTITEPGHLSGTGLGLSIADAIVRAHGGHITVKTAPGGTTFTIRLPAVSSGLIPSDSSASGPV